MNRFQRTMARVYAGLKDGSIPPDPVPADDSPECEPYTSDPRADDAHRAVTFCHYVTAVERLCKGRPPGIDPAEVKEWHLYVLDWRAEDPDPDRGITVDLVTAVTACPATGRRCVVTPDGEIDAASFAALVVAGPFPWATGPANPEPPPVPRPPV